MAIKWETPRNLTQSGGLLTAEDLNAMTGKAISGQDFNAFVCRALGIDESRVSRIVIDSQFSEGVRVHVEHVGDGRLLNIDMAAMLKGAKVDRGE